MFQLLESSVRLTILDEIIIVVELRLLMCGSLISLKLYKLQSAIKAYYAVVSSRPDRLTPNAVIKLYKLPPVCHAGSREGQCSPLSV